LPEALEKWPVSLLERVVPRHLQIIYEINRRFMADAGLLWKDDPERLKRVSILQEGYEAQIRMAHLAIVGSHSVNGVSKLHTELVKTRLVPDFHQLWPERFSNKTNGVTQRRWLLMANPGLANLLDATIGPGWATDLTQLSAVEKFADDVEFQRRFTAIKRVNKERLARIVNRIAAVDVNPAAMFDIQAKRIHEYKRQLLMALGIVHQYLQLADDGVEPPGPRTYLLGGKAAPGYWAAKMIVKLINNLGEVINNDPKTRELIKVAFLPDYRVSLAEKIIPAADVSEQISTAGREASGTGNMKFAMNGALTVGTLDGANIEIREAVGAENIFIFGLTAEQIEELTLKGTYRPREYYESDPRLKRVLDELASDRFCPGEPGLFRWVRDALVNRDDYFLMADFGAYVDIQEQVSTEYQHPKSWTRKAILNLARIGYFSSDRAVTEYSREIWHLDQS
jgi:starch phosphorylase